MDLLRHLQYFVVVAEELHFGRAADRLHMAQPPLSQRIRGLERELGVQLFARTSRRVALTPAGRVLLDEARGLLAGAEQVRALMQQVRDGRLGELRAALPPGLRPSVLAGILNAFRDVRPHVRLDVREAPSSEQLRALHDGALDVALLLHPVLDPQILTGPVLEKELGVLVPVDSDLARQAEVDLGGLGDRALVLSPRAAAPEAYDELLATCRAYGFVPGDVHQAVRQEFGLGLVLAGDAVAFGEQPEYERDAVTWRPLVGRPLRLAVSTAWRADAAASAVAAYTDVVVETLCVQAGWQRAREARTPVARFPPRPSSGALS